MGVEASSWDSSWVVAGTNRQRRDRDLLPFSHRDLSPFSHHSLPEFLGLPALSRHPGGVTGSSPPGWHGPRSPVDWYPARPTEDFEKALPASEERFSEFPLLLTQAPVL